METDQKQRRHHAKHSGGKRWAAFDTDSKAEAHFRMLMAKRIPLERMRMADALPKMELDDADLLFRHQQASQGR